MQSTLQELVALALPRSGYFTAAEALGRGISRRMLSHHTSAGTLERLAYGIYRLQPWPPHPHEEMLITTLWAGNGSAISHASALALHGLGMEEAPPLIHVTVSAPFRGRRKGVAVHRGSPQAHEVEVVDGVPVTSVNRTLLDIAAADPATARAATRLALERGLSSVESLEDAVRAGGDEHVRRLLLGSLPAGPTKSSAGQKAALPGWFDAADLPAPDDEADFFVGRQRELIEVLALLVASRLVTLTGPPGVGKSRLARQVAVQSLASYPDGVFVVDMTTTTAEPATVARAVAGALSLWNQPGRPLIAGIVDHLEAQQLLVVLDNCEHVIGGCTDLVENVIAACPRVDVLATSQAPIDVAGEQLWSVPPLGVPDVGAELAAIAQSEAVQLFCHRAAATSHGFRIDEETAPVVGEICRRLDGIPLAIELAAARSGVLTPADIAARLDDRLSLLGDRSVQGRDRHLTLRATLEWSYDRLPVDEQRLLRHLSIFAGSFTADAVEGVCGHTDDNASQSLLDSLASVVAKSLVVVDTRGAHARYRLLESIRLFAGERLAAAAETLAAQARHRRWFAAMAVEAEPDLTGPDQLGCLARLDADHDNLRAALRGAIEGDHGEDALQLAASLALFWRVRGHFSEGRGWLGSAIGMKATKVDLIVRAKSLFGGALLSIMVGDDQGGVELGEQALQLAREAGYLGGEARSLLVLANARLWTEPEVAVDLLEESASVARQAGDSWCLAHALGLLGRARLDAGDYAGARRPLDECIAVARAANDLQSLRLGLLVAGELAVHRGDYRRAHDMLSDDLRIARQLGEPYAVAVALAVLGELAAGEGRLEQARQLQCEALAVGRQLGSPGIMGVALHALGVLSQFQGEVAAARHCFEEAASFALKAGQHQGGALHGLGGVAVGQGDPAEARRLFNEALAIVRARGDDRNVAVTLSSLGHLDRQEGDAGRAIARHLEALRLLHKMGDVPNVTSSLEAVAGVACEMGRFEQAARLFGAAQAIRQRKGYPRSPVTQDGVEADLAAVAKSLGEERFEAALAQGAAMSPAGAVAYARRGWGTRARAERGWASLTTTEREVAALVASGLTNDQVGERLFSSGRTVGSHLSSIFAKLGITSRTQLAGRQTAEGGTELLT